jgi:hypothetical protein
VSASTQPPPPERVSQANLEEVVEDDFHQFEDISLNELQGIDATERPSQASTISGGANLGIFYER